MSKTAEHYATKYHFDELADFAENVGIDHDAFCDFFWNAIADGFTVNEMWTIIDYELDAEQLLMDLAESCENQTLFHKLLHRRYVN